MFTKHEGVVGAPSKKISLLVKNPLSEIYKAQNEMYGDIEKLIKLITDNALLGQLNSRDRKKLEAFLKPYQQLLRIGNPLGQEPDSPAAKREAILSAFDPKSANYERWIAAFRTITLENEEFQKFIKYTLRPLYPDVYAVLRKQFDPDGLYEKFLEQEVMKPVQQLPRIELLLKEVKDAPDKVKQKLEVTKQEIAASQPQEAHTPEDPIQEVFQKIDGLTDHDIQHLVPKIQQLYRQFGPKEGSHLSVEQAQQAGLEMVQHILQMIGEIKGEEILPKDSKLTPQQAYQLVDKILSQIIPYIDEIDRIKKELRTQIDEINEAKREAETELASREEANKPKSDYLKQAKAFESMVTNIKNKLKEIGTEYHHKNREATALLDAALTKLEFINPITEQRRLLKELLDARRRVKALEALSIKYPAQFREKLEATRQEVARLEELRKHNRSNSQKIAFEKLNEIINELAEKKVGTPLLRELFNTKWKKGLMEIQEFIRTHEFTTNFRAKETASRPEIMEDNNNAAPTLLRQKPSRF